MDNYFDREFLALERELKQLKTAAQRSSGAVVTTSQAVSVSVPLAMNSSQTECSGEKKYRLVSDRDTIFNITLDWYNENVIEAWRTARISRSARIETAALNDGSILVNVLVVGTNWSTDGSDDLSRLERGESVNVGVNMTVLATDDFEIQEVQNG